MKFVKYFLFLPIALILSFVTRVRNILFDQGIFKQQRFPCKVISVGNLALGGTGKTPVVAHLVEMLKDQGKSVAIVSRGYKGSYKALAEKVDISINEASQMFGDEPTWFAKVLDIPVYVGKRRADAIKLALEDHNFDVIVADDAFQHRWIARDKNIVLIDVMDSNMDIFPLGHLREPFSSLKRADLVFLTKCNLAPKQNLEHINRIVAGYGFSSDRDNLYQVDYELEDLVPFEDQDKEKVLNSKENVVLLSALAQPQSFEGLIAKDFNILHHFQYPDHHFWSQKDIAEVLHYCQHVDCENVIVTEKDAVKMEDFSFEEVTFWVANLELKFYPELGYEDIL